MTPAPLTPPPLTSLWRDRGAAALGMADAVADATLAGEDEAAALAAAVAEHAPGAGALVYRFAEEERTLVCVAASTPFEQAVGVRVRLGEGVAGWVASRLQPIVVPDRRDDPRGDHLAALPAAAAHVAGLAVPVPRRGGYVGGVVEAYRCDPLQAEPADVRVLARAAALLRDVGPCPPPDERHARAVVGAQEEERRRLAADIHDGITQRLASLGFHLSAAAAGTDPAFVAAEIAAARVACELLGDETHAALRDLRPPELDRLGLDGALASLARAIPAVAVEVRVLGAVALPAHVQTALYRICQEALHNVARHAQASGATVELDLTGADAVVLRIVDDGRGLPGDPAPGPTCPTGERGLGLAGMRDRAETLGGALTLSSVPGRGTTVLVTVPRA